MDSKKTLLDQINTGLSKLSQDRLSSVADFVKFVAQQNTLNYKQKKNSKPDERISLYGRYKGCGLENIDLKEIKAARREMSQGFEKEIDI